MLNFELLLRQFKYTVIVDLITNLPEKIGHVARGRCRSSGRRLWLLRQSLTSGQQCKGCHRGEQPLSEPVNPHVLATSSVLGTAPARHLESTLCRNRGHSTMLPSRVVV